MQSRGVHHQHSQQNLQRANLISTVLALKNHVVQGEQQLFQHLIAAPTLAQPSYRALPLLKQLDHLKPKLIRVLDELLAAIDHSETWSLQYQLIMSAEQQNEST